jgi:2-succinyl-5-enolpyruvyl-6-hydroxy-3-cyclohexene-1-carboxylate synthase
VVTTFAPDAVHVVVDPFGRWPDPGRRARSMVRAEPGGVCRRLVAGSTDDRSLRAPGAWTASWRDAERRAAAAVDEVLGSRPCSEPGVAYRLAATLAGRPGHANLVVSSSMPIRDVEAFGAAAGGVRVLANRGANGIDGVVSTALGVTVASPEETVALVGDLAFLHDSSALVRSDGWDVALTVVVLDNGGGGIFSFLPPASALDPARFEQLFGTPQGPDVAAVARGFGWAVDEVDWTGSDGSDGGGLERALERCLARRSASVLVVRVPGRDANVAAHDEVNRAVVRAVEDGSDAG